MATKKCRTATSDRKVPPRQRFDVVPGGAISYPLDPREEWLFRSLDVANRGRVVPGELSRALTQVGLSRHDARLRESMAALDQYQAAAAEDEDGEAGRTIPKDALCKALRPNITLIERALQGNLVIPDFAEFCDEIGGIWEEVRDDRAGEPARYIPQLDLVEPEVDRFGVAICTIDGQRHAVGDAARFFPIESTCKPINYCLALEEHGEETVHAYVGHEPSGLSFNELTLNRSNRPHNPMINAGAIMSSALIRLRERRAQSEKGKVSEMEARGWAGTRFDHVMDRWSAACGGARPHFNNAVYLSERETADRNFALAYHMREKGAFPAGIDLHDVLDFYFQCCSIELNCEMMSVVAATLANGGICPLSGERVFSTSTVQNCLSLMSSCGMYEYSGEFAFNVGLPAKSGVSGAILIVIPNVMGICTWSPRLDEHGNSVRGLAFCRQLVARFNIHNYDNLTGRSAKRDPRVSRVREQASRVNELIWAASKGDLGAIHDQLLRGASLSCADYDLRTPLHLAAAQNQAHVVRFIIEHKVHGDESIDLNPRDRWGGTPLDDAHLHDNTTIIEMLGRAGGERGSGVFPAACAVAPVSGGPQTESRKAGELIWAASTDDLGAIRRLVAQGVPLDLADYDLRSPLHLAAAEGHAGIVRYLIAQAVEVNPRDRWGNTPLDDATRHGRDEVADALRQAGAWHGGSAGHGSTSRADAAA
ncbi:MAG: glutaminase A [Pseudomonadota bacterium]